MAFSAVFVIFVLSVVCFAQENQSSIALAPQIVIDNAKDSDVFSFNRTVVVKGVVLKGVMAFGGDVIVEGRVEGDVATIGGSVIQKENSFIGGDVIVLGGGYHHGKTAPLRNPQSQTVIYAGYEEELREIAQNPTLLVAPHFSASYLAQRILTTLFWFVISLVLITISPGAVSRAITRLNLTRLRVAMIGVLAALIGTIGVALGLRFLPSTIGVALGLMTIIILFLAYVFGRVCVHAATGKFLQKKMFGEHYRSDSIALLLGAVWWTIILSLPFVWIGIFPGLLIVSLGVVLSTFAERSAPLNVKSN